MNLGNSSEAFNSGLNFSLKRNIFGTFEVILSNANFSLTKQIVLLFIEFLQILFFIFHRVFIEYWKSNEVYEIIMSVLNYFMFYPLLKNDFNFFRIMFYIAFLVLIVFIALLVSFLIRTQKNMKLDNILVYIYYEYFNLFSTVLLLPFLYAFTVPFKCKNGETNKDYNNLICLQSESIVMIIIGIFGTIITIINGYLISLFFIDTIPDLNKPHTKYSNIYDLSLFISKISLFFIMEFSEYIFETKEQKWICSIVIFFIFLSNFLILSNGGVYVDLNIQKYVSFLRLFEVFCSLMVLLNIIFPKDSNFNSDMSMIFIITIFLIASFILMKTNIYKILLKKTSLIKNECYLIKKLVYLSYLTNFEHRKDLYLLLKGFIINQKDTDNKYLKHLKSVYMEVFKNNNSEEGIEKNDDKMNFIDNEMEISLNKSKNVFNSVLKISEYDEKVYFLRYLEECFKIIIEQENKNFINIQINSVYFQIVLNKNLQMAELQLNKLLQKDLLLSQEFNLYRLKKLLSKERLVTQFNNSNSVDIEKVILNKNNIDLCK